MGTNIEWTNIKPNGKRHRMDDRRQRMASGGGGILADGGAFAACILLWSIAAAAQGHALAAVGQQLAPKGSEATALALPRAIGDGVYVVAPATLGLVTDALSGTPGAGCAAAGVASALGAAALAVLLAQDDDGNIE